MGVLKNEKFSAKSNRKKYFRKKMHFKKDRCRNTFFLGIGNLVEKQFWGDFFFQGIFS
jgi:hypothetical protein